MQGGRAVRARDGETLEDVMSRILIVDDSRYQRQLVHTALAVLGGQIQEAADGAQAVRLFQEALCAGTPFDLVVMDILMPTMDGHRALSWMRRMEEQAGTPLRTKVIMLSSLDDPHNMLKAQFEEGAAAYLTKPFDPADMRDALRALELVDNPLDGGLCATF
jgi:two-component system chemotaxis response regulator CheY